MLAEKIRTDLTAAMKARDTTTLDTLRLLLARIKEAEVAGAAARELTDDEVAAVIARGVKERDEAIAAYTDAGRTDSADAERAQRAVLAAYLPEELTVDEVVRIVGELIAGAGLSGKANMGAAMALVKPAIAGRADGKFVAATVREALGA